MALYTALVMTIALTVGNAADTRPINRPVGLAGTVIGLGGRGDPACARVPDKLSGRVVPTGTDYLPSPYPATLNMIGSVRVGMPDLHRLVTTTADTITVVAYSEGTLLAEQEKRNLRNDSTAPAPQNLRFLEIASPFIPNGGIFARFPGMGIPYLIPGMGPARDTWYNTTYIANEYDPYADFPAYFNPAALLNTLMAVSYAHPDAFYDPVDQTSPENFVKEVENQAGGIDTYVLIPNKNLPLLGPIRTVAKALHLTPLTERLLGAVEPMLRVIVDMAYTDRENLKPEAHRPFSLFTPPHKIAEAIAATPKALREGLDNLLGRGPKNVEKQPGPEPGDQPRTASRGPTDMSDGNKVSPTTLAGKKPHERHPLTAVGTTDEDQLSSTPPEDPGSEAPPPTDAETGTSADTGEHPAQQSATQNDSAPAAA